MRCFIKAWSVIDDDVFVGDVVVIAISSFCFFSSFVVLLVILHLSYLDHLL